MNQKKLRRLYREEKLQVRRRGGRKRALGTRAPLALPQGPNRRWSLDFVADSFSDGRRFRILAAWKEDDNHVRPHSGLGGATPAEVAAAATQAGPRHASAQLAITARFGHHNSQRLCQ